MVTIICSNFGNFITKWTIDTPIVIFYHFFTMQTGNSYLQIIPIILNQFWPNLVNTYKIQFWTICVLCVVCKCQSLELFKKNLFLAIYVHISKDRNSLKNCSIGQFFFYSFRTFQLILFVLWVLWLFKNYEAKMSKKTECRGDHLGFLAAILDWQ